VTRLLPTQMSGLLFPTGFCSDIGSLTVHPASARCPEPCLFGGRDGGLWEWHDSSCHSLVGSFKIEFFFPPTWQQDQALRLPNLFTLRSLPHHLLRISKTEIRTAGSFHKSFKSTRQTDILQQDQALRLPNLFTHHHFTNLDLATMKLGQ
jgi:hypothetical protein